MTELQTAQWAKGYANLGWEVFPLPRGKKFPPPDGVTGADGVAWPIEKVLENLEPGSNLGIRMPDGVIGIDIDAYGEKRGAETIRQEELVWGKLPPSPRLTSRDDGTSGIRFYRVPPGTEIRTPGPHVDIIRRSHRFAVAAPSLHPEGRQYQWLDEAGNPCPPPAVDSLPELPGAWVAAHGSRASQSRGSSATYHEAIAHAKKWWSDLPAGLAECTSVRDAREEGLVAAAREGRTRTARHDLLGPVLKLCLMAESDSPCPGVREAVAEVGKRYVSLPDGEDHSEKFWHLVGTTLDRLGSEKPWECLHVTEADTDAFTALVAGWDPAAPPAGDAPDNPYAYVDFSDEAFWNPPAPVYFIPGMLIEGEVCTIYSAGGKGKSLLAQDITLGLVERGHVFGQPVELQDVLYVDRENSARGLAKRFKAMGHVRGPLPRLHYSLLGQWPPLDTREGGAALLAEVKRTGARLVVLDTMSKMVDGEENANDTWNGLHQYSMVALKRMGVTVIQLDHTGKDADRGQRGGSSKQNNADVIWKLDYAAGYVTLTCEKDREGEYDPLVYLERQPVPVLVHRPTTASPVAVAKAVAAGEKADALVAALDDLSVPASTGRDKAWKALMDAGVSCQKDDVMEAQKVRRERCSDAAEPSLDSQPGDSAAGPA